MNQILTRTESLTKLEDEEEDAIIDVIDEDSEEEDPLEALKGALQRLLGLRGAAVYLPSNSAHLSLLQFTSLIILDSAHFVNNCA